MDLADILQQITTAVPSWMSHHVLAFCVTFINVFMKGFQYKNVIHKNHRLMILTSFFMAFCDALTIGLIAKNGWHIAFACGLGGGLGISASVWAHDKLFKRKEDGG